MYSMAFEDERLELLHREQDIREIQRIANQIYDDFSPPFLDALIKKQLSELNESRALWFILKNLLIRHPEYYNVFKGIVIEQHCSQLTIHYLLGVLLKMKQMGHSASEHQIDYVVEQFESLIPNLEVEQFDLCARNLTMFSTLCDKSVSLGVGEFAMYVKLTKTAPISCTEMQPVMNIIDNSEMLKLAQIEKQDFRNVCFRFSFTYFPRQMFLHKSFRTQAIPVIMHMYRNRRDCSDTMKYLTLLAAALKFDAQACRFLISNLLDSDGLSFEQITFFVVHVLTEFDSSLLAEVCSETQAASPLLEYLRLKFAVENTGANFNIAQLTETQIQLVFYIYLQTKEYDHIDSCLLERLVASEELSHNIKLLAKAEFTIDEFVREDLRCETAFHYVDLVKSEEVLLMLAKELISADCYDFEEVFDKLTKRLPTAALEELFKYYRDNFEVEADLRHRWIFIAEFVRRLARELGVAQYTFLGVQCPEDVCRYVYKAFDCRIAQEVLVSAFLIEQLDAFPEEMTPNAIVCMYTTQNVSSHTRESNQQTAQEELLPIAPDIKYDPDDINTYILAQVSPPTEFRPSQNENTISCCLHFLKSVVALGNIREALSRRLYVYLLTVQIVPTIKYILKHLPQPSAGLQAVIRQCLMQNGFHTIRNSASLRYVCAKLFKPDELRQLYHPEKLQLVHICLDEVPLEDIIARIDGTYAQTTTFAAAMGLFAHTKEKNYSTSAECGFLDVKCGKTGTICKLIALKHIKITGSACLHAQDFLLKQAATTPKEWSDEQIHILASHGLVLQCDVCQYEEIASELPENVRKHFLAGIKMYWGTSIDELMQLVAEAGDASALAGP